MCAKNASKRATSDDRLARYCLSLDFQRFSTTHATFRCPGCGDQAREIKLIEFDWTDKDLCNLHAICPSLLNISDVVT